MQFHLNKFFDIVFCTFLCFLKLQICLLLLPCFKRTFPKGTLACTVRYLRFVIFSQLKLLNTNLSSVIITELFGFNQSLSRLPVDAVRCCMDSSIFNILDVSHRYNKKEYARLHSAIFFLPYLYIVWKIIDDRLTRETEFILRVTALPFYTCECLTVRLEPWNTLTQSSHPLCVFCQQTCSKQGITSSFECNVRMQKRFLPIHFIYRHTNS